MLLESLTPCVFIPELDLSARGPVPGWWPTVDRGGHTHPDITSSPEKHQSCVKSDWHRNARLRQRSGGLGTGSTAGGTWLAQGPQCGAEEQKPFVATLVAGSG